ncbi:hypothetical protein DFH11DRAFT_1545665 [Phellopilus nigrolimitatus]|nr:hypothetical protein DFH11DRAFT_1545665 [Phellopilus nigrolimitatus]
MIVSSRHRIRARANTPCLFHPTTFRPELAEGIHPTRTLPTQRLTVGSVQVNDKSLRWLAYNHVFVHPLKTLTAEAVDRFAIMGWLKVLKRALSLPRRERHPGTLESAYMTPSPRKRTSTRSKINAFAREQEYACTPDRNDHRRKANG